MNCYFEAILIAIIPTMMFYIWLTRYRHCAACGVMVKDCKDRNFEAKPEGKAGK